MRSIATRCRASRRGLQSASSEQYVAAAGGLPERLYERSKRSVVWLVKQLDSHLCDLDRRIEERIAARAKARAEGNFEQIATEQNRLGELCIEHKARLDSMLFMWVLGGLVSVAGWTRASLRTEPSSDALHTKLDRSTLVTMIRQEMSNNAVASDPQLSIAAEVEAAVRKALEIHSGARGPEAPRTRFSPFGTAAAGPASSGVDDVSHPETAADLRQRRTYLAALGACGLSAASLLILSSRR